MRRLSSIFSAALRLRPLRLPIKWNWFAKSPVKLSLEASQEPVDEPVVRLKGGTTFYRNFPQAGVDDSQNTPLFNLNSGGFDPAPVFTVPSATEECEELRRCLQQHWAIMGPGSTEFLHLLRGDYFASDPDARQYPFLSTAKARHRSPDKAFRYVGFEDERRGAKGTYLSARYESWREATDWTVRQYLTGQTSLNALETEPTHSEDLLNRVVSDLQLRDYIDMPFVNLSHGQARRAHIAKALMEEPEVLLIDNPFFGLDPRSVQFLSGLLYRLAVKNSPRVVMALRPQDDLPDWITHLAMFGHDGDRFHLLTMGDKARVRKDLLIWNCTFTRLFDELFVRLKPDAVYGDLMPHKDQPWYYKHLKRLEPELVSRAENAPLTDPFPPMVIELLRELCIAPGLYPRRATRRHGVKSGEPIIEMSGVRVEYNGKVALGGWTKSFKHQVLSWQVRRGHRWGVFGPNGSGKTTLLSLITSDHPQAYAQPVKVFGLPRLPTPGSPAMSYFELHSRIGHTSPEVHALFPRQLSVRTALESAWADTPVAKPALDPDRNDLVDGFLYFFEPELNPGFGPSVERTRQESIECYRNLDESIRPPPETRLPTATWASDVTFGSLSVTQQKIVLFLRAIIKSPDLVILDEAFSGMPTLIRDKCLHFLEAGFGRRVSTGSARVRDFRQVWHITDIALLDALAERYYSGLTFDQTLIVTSHTKHEIPNSLTHWMRLPGPQELQRGGRPAIDKFPWDMTIMSGGWEEIWSQKPDTCDPPYYGDRGQKWILDYYVAPGPPAPPKFDFLRNPGNDLVEGLFEEGHMVFKAHNAEEILAAAQKKRRSMKRQKEVRKMLRRKARKLGISFEELEIQMIERSKAKKSQSKSKRKRRRRKEKRAAIRAGELVLSTEERQKLTEMRRRQRQRKRAKKRLGMEAAAKEAQRDAEKEAERERGKEGQQEGEAR